MNEVIFEMPVGIAVEFPCWNASNADVGILLMANLFTPSNANLGGEFGDILVILEISPKFNLSTGFLV